MANSTLNIVVNEVIPIGGQITFNLQGTDVTHDWVAARTGIGEVTVGTTITETINNYVTALNLDYPSLLTAFFSGVGRQLQITADTFGDNFYSADSNGLNVTFSIVNTSRALTILGISGDNYLINNPINITVQSPYPIELFNIQFTNLTNQITTGVFNIYPDSKGNAELNIAPIIKSIFSDPNHMSTGDIVPNLNTVEISVNFEGSLTPTTITKSFIRGGKRTVGSNQTIPLNTWLQPSVMLPYWAGYPITGYYLETVSSNRQITEKVQGQIPVELVDFRRDKSCNPVYVKFLNQMGGYSYWLFDSYNETEANNNLGSFIKDNRLMDLGNEAESKIQVISKVPTEYIQLMKDLVVSPEIYIQVPAEETSQTRAAWKMVLSDKNTITQDYNKRSYSVKFNLLPEYRFNPSYVWSN